MANVIAIILAGGKGTRCSSDIPKQYVYVAGRPVVMWSIEAFRKAIPGVQTVMVINPETTEIWAELCRKHEFESPKLVPGGATRWQSVKNAIDAIVAEPDDIILVHDGARPVIDSATILAVKEMAEKCDGAIPTVPVTDSLRMMTGEESSVAVERSQYRAVQTPQGFRHSILSQAYSLPCSPAFTDDASVAEAAGYTELRLVEGNPKNIKLTFAGDIATVENSLKNAQWIHLEK